MILYNLTYKQKNGLRVLLGANQGRHFKQTRTQADQYLRDLLANNSEECLASVYGKQAIGTFRVDAFDCYDHGDAKGIYVDEKNETTLFVAVKRLWGQQSRLDEAIRDVREGRFSMSKGRPVEVSRLDSPRGALFVVDGYHRVVEETSPTIEVFVSEHVPRIEHTGGAYVPQLAERVHLCDAMRK